MFTGHLKEQSVTYRQHQKLAFFIARQSFKVSVIAFIHGLCPSFFQTGASTLHNQMMPEYNRMHEEFKSKNK